MEKITGYVTVFLTEDNRFALNGHINRTPECAIIEISPFEGAKVAGIAEVSLDFETEGKLLSGLEFRIQNLQLDKA